MTFQTLNLTDEILKALQDEGYSNPTPIQEKAIPIVLSKRDLLGCAQTGTGKTAAFAIPIIQLLNQTSNNSRNKPIRCLIVTPTRELAIQIGDSIKAYGRYTNLTSTVIFGGVKQNAQTQALQKGIDILVATPGRLLDLINQRFISLKQIELFVLDEADRMLDMGFIHDVKKIIACLPQKRQSLFFSATMPPEIVKLSSTILSNPAKVEVAPISSTAETIQQQLYFVDKPNKNSLLLHLLENKNIKTVLVFTRTKHGADKIVKVLVRNNIKAQAIHGNKAQNARQNALANFKAQTTRVLVATDIAARGIDVDDLEYVINFDIPNISETYVHRIGRTGRAGNNGTAISFCDAEEKAYIKDIEKLIALKIPVVQDHPYPLMINNPVKAEKPAHHQGKPRPNHTANKGKSSFGSDRNKGPRNRR
jgi:ATP-dependent RNA helicase RhlE